MNDWKKMIEGKLYNPGASDVGEKHMKGLVQCDKFNRIPLWKKKQNNVLWRNLYHLEKEISWRCLRLFIANMV